MACAIFMSEYACLDSASLSSNSAVDAWFISDCFIFQKFKPDNLWQPQTLFLQEVSVQQDARPLSLFSSSPLLQIYRRGPQCIILAWQAPAYFNMMYGQETAPKKPLSTQKMARSDMSPLKPGTAV